MHVRGRGNVAERRSCMVERTYCMAALLPMSVMLLQQPFVWTCQSECGVCIPCRHPAFAVKTMYHFSVGGLWVINHDKLGDTKECNVTLSLECIAL